MIESIIDVRIVRMKYGKVVKDYGVHDGRRDGKDVALKYYSAGLQPGELLHCTPVERKQIFLSDLTETQRLEVQRDRRQASVDSINQTLGGDAAAS